MLGKRLSYAAQWQDGLQGVLYKARATLPKSQSSEFMLLQGRTAVTQKQSDERKNPVPILYLFNINMPEQNQGTIVELSLDFEKQTVISTRFHKFFDFSFLS